MKIPLPLCVGVLVLFTGCGRKTEEAHVLFTERAKDRVVSAGSFQSSRDLNTCYQVMRSTTVWEKDVVPKLSKLPSQPTAIRASLRMRRGAQKEESGNLTVEVTFALEGHASDDLASILRLMIDAVNLRLGDPPPFASR